MNRKRLVRWVVRAEITIIILLGAIVVIQMGYLRPWTGFGQINPKENVQPAKTLWDWMDLLIVPVVLAIGGFLFTRSETQATQAAADQRTRDEALQAYLDGMSELLLDKGLLDTVQANDTTRPVARARTLTVLPRFDASRKARVVQFLYESGLIKNQSIVGLSGADLRDVNLSGANLEEAVLSEANLGGANLGKAILSEADLHMADLRNADLSRANLFGANLSGANLSYADLWGINLVGANLSGANITEVDLWDADLSGANLTGANLSGANLSGANLSGANISEADIRSAYLSDANLRKADLSNSNLQGSTLGGVDVSGRTTRSMGVLFRVILYAMEAMGIRMKADLSEADLSGANLSWARGWTMEQLTAARCLEGATMPDGQKYEDWRKEH